MMMETNEVISLARRAVQLYAETHPRPTQVTQLQAAEMLGISRATVSRMVKAGQLKLNRCGMIPIELVDEARASV
ncbi:helix-turn-helix domain-containing protein [Burkholderia pseudomallei]|uniref:helix-turn-helix domain-containing protein n=5 Tax=Burkholderia pseudomallei TaxID=28450 RepID=UPI001F277ECE|nr:helix-turn-helix domain-containing protein [Burkholderia pseudomallei]MCW0101202.1 helix-turn-helix domain-containing protein [Burkholderia pseudomallei]